MNFKKARLRKVMTHKTRITPTTKVDSKSKILHPSKGRALANWMSFRDLMAAAWWEEILQWPKTMSRQAQLTSDVQVAFKRKCLKNWTRSKKRSRETLWETIAESHSWRVRGLTSLSWLEPHLPSNCLKRVPILLKLKLIASLSNSLLIWRYKLREMKWLQPKRKPNHLNL